MSQESRPDVTGILPGCHRISARIRREGWPDGAGILIELIVECYERKSLIITTNIEFSRWVNVFYDEQMTGAILDRLLHHCHLLLFTGTSYRMKQANLF